jgi:hypothetical protein
MHNPGSADLKMFEHGLQPEHAVHFIFSKDLAESDLRADTFNLICTVMFMVSVMAISIDTFYIGKNVLGVSIAVGGSSLLALVVLFVLSRSIKKLRKRIKYFEDLINQCYSGKSSS